MLEKITDKIEGYAENKLELFKLEIEEKVDKITTGIIKIIVLAISSLMFLLFITIGLSFLLNDLLGSLYAGFLIMSGFYLLIFLIIYFNRDHKIFKEFKIVDLN